VRAEVKYAAIEANKVTCPRIMYIALELEKMIK